MDLLIQALIGFVVVPAYNRVKAKLGLSGANAAWLLAVLLLLVALPVTLATGGFSKLVFDAGNPWAFLKAVGQAFLVLVGSAEGLYMLTKKRVPPEKKK